jgi:peptidoglycan hydrolase CwlO-like protein
MIRNLYYISVKISAIILLCTMVFLPIEKALAVSAADAAYYEKQAAQKLAEANQKKAEAQIYNDQIYLYNKQINQLSGAINTTNGKINDTQDNIDNLTQSIKDEEFKLSQEQDKNGDVIASWYIEGQDGLLEAMIGSNNLSEVATKQQYFDSVRRQIELACEKIQLIKADLAKQKGEQENQLQTLSGLKEDQTARQDTLEATKTSKNRLLNDTKNAIVDLKAQASEYQAEANRIRTILAAIYNSSGKPVGSDLKSSVDGSWYYSQTDSRWRDKNLSPSYLKIGEYGCYITSLAMVSTYYKNSITPPEMVDVSNFNKSGSFYGFDGNSGITIVQQGRVNWDTVNSELASGHPVIVSVYTGHGTAFNADGSNHFIVIRGNSGGVYQIQDPYWMDGSYNISQVKSMKIIRSY